MKALFYSAFAICLFVTTYVHASEESVFEAGTVAECRANATALLLVKENEGWDCSVSTNTGTCTKDGIRAVIYCNGSKLVISMHKN